MTSYIGYIAGFLAMACFSTLPIVIKRVTSLGLNGSHLILVNALMLALLSMVTIAVMHQNSYQIFKKIPISTYGWVALYTLFNFTALTLFIWSMQRISTTEYQIMFLASPLIVALLAFFLLNEPLQLKHLIGGIFVAIGIVITVR